MAQLLNTRYIRMPVDKQRQKQIYALVLERMQAAIATEIEKPAGLFTSNDLELLQKELYR